MTLSEMRRILTERDIQLTKSLGQNFLFDQNQLKRIAAAAELNGSDKVLEIGPGLGPLTELLLTSAREVLAIEKDARLVDILRNRFNTARPGPPLELIHDDALEWLRRNSKDWTGWKMVSNLPYSVASPILAELCHAPRAPDLMVATLQIEVAQRLLAKPGTRDYGVLTLLVQAEYQPGSWFKIPPTCFFPAPDVASACVCLTRRPEPILTKDERPIFDRIIKQSFSQRRKMMFKLLKDIWPASLLEQAFAKSQIPINSRAEDVSLDKFIRLTRRLLADSSQ
jgi:16S rRNA (adenine1518-N6/adenine1519-N6)-dimethyltransferase